MQSFHDASGHCGHTKTWSQLQKRFYWEGCHKEVKSYCRACQFCFKRKRVADAKAGLPLSLPTTTRYNQLVSIDFVGPVTETENGNKFILTIMDHCSRFIAAEPCKALRKRPPKDYSTDGYRTSIYRSAYSLIEDRTS